MGLPDRVASIFKTFSFCCCCFVSRYLHFPPNSHFSVNLRPNLHQYCHLLHKTGRSVAVSWGKRLIEIQCDCAPGPRFNDAQINNDLILRHIQTTKIVINHTLIYARNWECTLFIVICAISNPAPGLPDMRREPCNSNSEAY